ncbi:sialate O-acetylesterase [Nocardioides stalactiti]|uniref:sialate O-acetylesterase n=1 Tax=Nocardioides stalactiti TaxID=2755356 RepID=UPI0016047EAA|nr:sialate O-acetylesterase [Nocardioides stalactiti]
MHVLAIGQSNLANHCGSPRTAARGEVRHLGTAQPLQDPVPGGSGDLGSVWPRVVDELAALGTVGDDAPFVLTLAAQGGTSVAEWAPGGPCHDLLMTRVADGDLDGVTHVVWQQGEKDTLLETRAADYTADFLRLHASVTAVVGAVPWIICRTSYRFGVTSAAVVSAQTELARTVPGAVAGPDLDALGPQLRRDDTHFNDEGLLRFASLLAPVLAGASR